MGNDLISRKALLTELSKWDITKMYLPSAFKELVKEQPTAYDPDKIVEQLDDLEIANVYDYYERMYFDYISLVEAIKIVKGGQNA